MGSGANPIHWTVNNGLDALRTGTPPAGANALLFVLLRHAVLRMYALSALRIVKARGLAAPGEGIEPGLDGAGGPSPWDRLAAPLDGVTAAGETLAAHIDAVRAANHATGSPAAAQLTELMDVHGSLRQLISLPDGGARPPRGRCARPRLAPARRVGLGAGDEAPERAADQARDRRAARRLRRARGRAPAERRSARRATATSTRPRSGRRRPPRSCAPATSRTSATTPRTRSRSISPRAACGSRSRCWTACARASRSARCSATGSSAGCTRTTPSSCSTATSRRCARSRRSTR